MNKFLAPALPDCLNQFDSIPLLLSFFSLSEQQAFYLLDNHQQVVYWSAGIAQLLGYQQTDVIHKHCPLGLEISPTDTLPIKSSVHLIDANGLTQHVIKSTCQLPDLSGRFAGGLGLLKPCHSTYTAPKITRKLDAKQNFHGILSRSPAMQAVFQIIENAAETTATVLVRGESGAGKELVAKAIHQLSARHNAPFLAINCAALSGNLLESELFGHVRGAFTGALKDHKGLFQRAHGGTLFLDEVAEMSLELQAKLLRVIQERNYTPVGGDRSIAVDVRLVAATHRSLREQVKKGEFREDLMYRLRVVPLFIPPLRERREDISLLLWHFINLHNAENYRRIEQIDPAAMQVLLDYAWPGNVRELHNVVEYAFAVGRSAVLQLHELPPEFRELSHQEAQSIEKKSFKEQESAAISSALAECNGKITPAARLLGMSRATFWRKRRQYGI